MLLLKFYKTPISKTFLCKSSPGKTPETNVTFHSNEKEIWQKEVKLFFLRQFCHNFGSKSQNLWQNIKAYKFTKDFVSPLSSFCTYGLRAKLRVKLRQIALWVYRNKNSKKLNGISDKKQNSWISFVFTHLWLF